jgi:DNA-binding MarR family transcriptional regulator
MGSSGIREKHDGALEGSANLRLWLRLLSCTITIEKRVKRRLADQFGATLPRFDVLAALERKPDGMTMGELSRSLLVSNGNVTALVQTLAADDYVTLSPSPDDRRVSRARLTRRGSAYFAELAKAHHGWIDELFAGLSPAERGHLHNLLGALKVSIAEAQGEGER